jgi:hypothetical protein
MNSLQQWVNDKSIRLGLAAGLIGLPLSFAGRGLNLGRELGNPLPLVLGFSQALRGNFLYLNWRGMVWHLLFLLFLLLLVVAILHGWLPKSEWQQIRIGSAARFAAVINIFVVALTEIDAVVVLIWYLMAGIVSLFFVGLMANGVVKLMRR